MVHSLARSARRPAVVEDLYDRNEWGVSVSRSRVVSPRHQSWRSHFFLNSYGFDSVAIAEHLLRWSAGWPNYPLDAPAVHWLEYRGRFAQDSYLVDLGARGPRLPRGFDMWVGTDAVKTLGASLLQRGETAPYVAQCAAHSTSANRTLQARIFAQNWTPSLPLGRPFEWDSGRQADGAAGAGQGSTVAIAGASIAGLFHLSPTMAAGAEALVAANWKHADRAADYTALGTLGVRWFVQPWLCMSASFTSRLEGRLALAFRDAPGGSVRAELTHIVTQNNNVKAIGSVCYETAHRTYVTAARRTSPVVLKTRIELATNDRYGLVAEIAAPDAGIALSMRTVYSRDAGACLVGAEIHINEPIARITDLFAGASALMGTAAGAQR